MLANPLSELKQEVTEELLRRSGKREQLVPIDRDAVPQTFEDRVQRYYESIGGGVTE